MKKLLKKLVLFLIVLFIAIELFIRVMHLTIDVARRQIDSNGIQKYIPNQTGSWTRNVHTWEINKYGWPVAAPESMDKLITLIGDSHIENFMNNKECQPSYFLKKLNPDYNFMQMGRSGATLIEYMEFSKDAQKYSPLRNIIFVKESDFPESIRNIVPASDITQLDVVTKELIPGKMKLPLLKSIVYNIKTVYYFKDRIHLETLKKKPTVTKAQVKRGPSDENLKQYDELVKYIAANYDTKNVIFAFHPGTDPRLVAILDKYGLNTYQFDGDDTWASSISDNSHWSCVGHSEAAKQLTEVLKLK